VGANCEGRTWTARSSNGVRLEPPGTGEGHAPPATWVRFDAPSCGSSAPGDYPEGLVTLPEHAVRDLGELVTRAQQLTPGASIDSVVLTIWRLGSQRLDQNLRRRIPLRLADLPFTDGR
jgi:hypothetical protein